MARLIVGRSRTNCSECGGNALPGETHHIHGGPGVSGFTEGSSLSDTNGCGVFFDEPEQHPYVTPEVLKRFHESLEHATCRIRTDEEEDAVRKAMLLRNSQLLEKMGRAEIVLDVLDK